MPAASTCEVGLHSPTLGNLLIAKVRGPVTAITGQGPWCLVLDEPGVDEAGFEYDSIWYIAVVDPGNKVVCHSTSANDLHVKVEEFELQ